MKFEEFFAHYFTIIFRQIDGLIYFLILKLTLKVAQTDRKWQKTNRKSFVVDITMMIMVNGMETFAEWLNKNVATQLNNY